MENRNHLPQPLSFYSELKQIGDTRDSRGKRHESLSFIIGSLLLALLMNRKTLSSIQRFIKNRIKTLQKCFQEEEVTFISRAQFPRIMATVDWRFVSNLTQKHFGFPLIILSQEWVALDGKVLRGSSKKEQIAFLFAVTHETRRTLEQQPLEGKKENEVPHARIMIETSFLGHKVTLDALHLNPKTTSLIHQGKGIYSIQVKENQLLLLEKLQNLTQENDPFSSTETTEKGHGRITNWNYEWFSLEKEIFDSRWNHSGFSILVKVVRDTLETKTEKASQETSWYLSNQNLEKEQKKPELHLAIRRHWSVESENWIRDATFKEDQFRTKDHDIAILMGALRTTVVQIFRKLEVKNFKERIDLYRDSQDELQKDLSKLNFL